MTKKISQLRTNVNASPFLTSTVLTIFVVVVVNFFILLQFLTLYTEFYNVYPSKRFVEVS